LAPPVPGLPPEDSSPAPPVGVAAPGEWEDPQARASRDITSAGRSMGESCGRPHRQGNHLDAS
jgi:hypothetical protein